MDEHLSTRFLDTSWTLIRNADASCAEQAGQALAQLCERYRYPVFAFIRRQTRSEADAADLCQAFFAEMIVQRRRFREADPEKGRFRTYLLSCLKGFLSNARRTREAQKRGGGTVHVPVDDLEERFLSEENSDVDPERTFDREWAREVFRNVWLQIEKGYSADDQLERFQYLQSQLMGDTTVSFAAKADQFGLTEGGLKTAAHRLRQRFHQALRHSIAQVVDHPADIDDEIRYLMRVIA